jgi:hypothetical protein
MANTLTGAQRYNNRMDRIFNEAIVSKQKYCKHLDYSENLTGCLCNSCGLEFNPPIENEID